MNQSGPELAARFLGGEAITLEFFHYSDDIAVTVNSMISRVMAHGDRPYMVETINTILREFLLNAVKANAKRIYFSSNSLDINKEDEYQKGMDEFRDDVMARLEEVKDDLEKSDLRVVFTMEKDPGGILFTISNNAPINPAEMERLRHRVIRGRNATDFSEVYESVFDSSEGAGLGIVLSILLIKNSGIDPENLKVTASSGGVRVSFYLPDVIHPVEQTSAIRRTIVEEIKNLPTFPENILEIQRLCEDPDSSIPNIAKHIRSDPSVTADVLKLSNSVGFLTGKRVETVQDAVMRIGLTEVKHLLTVSIARRILNSQYKRFEQVWDHCNRTASYAGILARDYGLSSIAEQVFISGLLHDIGTIVLMSADENVTRKITAIVNNHVISNTSSLEEITMGVSHSEIGEEIARHWNFPDYLVAAIRYHHAPAEAPAEFRDIASAVYLADMMHGIERKRYTWAYIDPDILQRFHISGEADMNRMVEYLGKRYDRQNYRGK